MNRAGGARAPAETAHRVAAGLLALVALAMAGLLTDLVLLEHYEDAWQVPPIVLLTLGLLGAGWCGIRRSAASLVVFAVLMAATMVGGGAGLVLHYRANAEFQREIDPDLAGWPLVAKVLHATAPPALAPAAMAQIGLFGLLYVYSQWRRTSPGSGPVADAALTTPERNT